MDSTDERIADAIAELTTPRGGHDVVRGVMARTRARTALGPLLIVPIVALAVVGIALTRGPAAGAAPESTPGSGASAAASTADAAEIAPCGQQLKPTDVQSVVNLATARDFADVFPAYKDRLPIEADSAAAAYVVILNGQYPIEALRRAPPPAGQTWPPRPTLAPGHRDVCLVIPGGGDGTGRIGRPLVAVYADIDVAGFNP